LIRKIVVREYFRLVLINCSGYIHEYSRVYSWILQVNIPEYFRQTFLKCSGYIP